MNAESVQRHQLYPLDVFYALEGCAPPDAESVDPEALPDLARPLLDHPDDMTGTLERHYQSPMMLEVLNSHRRRTVFLRKVLLLPAGVGRPVEFGAIAIHLPRYAPAAQEEILGCHKPLGRILRDYHVAYTNRLRGFVRIDGAPEIRRALCTRSGAPLFGRRNMMVNPAGEVIAEVLELLPPKRS